MTEQKKLRVLLPHWIEHNDEHAAEFRRWATHAGDATADIEEAAAKMQVVKRALTAALEKLGGPLEHGHHHDHEPKSVG